MSSLILPPISSKRSAISEFLRNGKSKRYITDNSYSLLHQENSNISRSDLITPPQKKFNKVLLTEIYPQQQQQQQRRENVNSSMIKDRDSQNIDQKEIIFTSQRRSPQNQSFEPFQNERDSLGNLIVEEKETKKKELNSYKKIASRLSAITLRSVPTGNKAILPNAYLSSQKSLTLEAEPELIKESSAKGDELNSSFVVRLNIKGIPPKDKKVNEYFLEDDENQKKQAGTSIDASYFSENPYQQHFTYKNQIKNDYKLMLKQNAILSSINEKEQPQHASKLHTKEHTKLKLIKSDRSQIQPSIGDYNPKYEYLQKHVESYIIQPLPAINTSERIKKVNQSQQLKRRCQSKLNRLSLSPKMDKGANSDDDGYEKYFNKMLRDIKKKVQQEQQMNQNNLLHVDGEIDLKKVISQEEIESITNTFKQQLGDMKNILNKFKNSLAQQGKSSQNN